MRYRAGRYIACDSHAHLVSKAGSMISAKSPLTALKWSINIEFIIEGDSSVIMNAILRSL